MSKLVVRFSKKGRDVKHLDFIGYLAMLDTVTIKGKDFPVVPATKGMNKGQVADKRVVFWKLYEKLYRLQIQNDGILRQAHQNGYKYVPVTVTKKQLAMYVAGYATEKPVDRMISQMIEMGLISREIKGLKGKGGSLYSIREPLENLLSQLPDEALKQMGFKAGELHTIPERGEDELQTVQEKDDNYLIGKEKESEGVEDSQHEEEKLQSDQEVSSHLRPPVFPEQSETATPLDDHKVNDETDSLRETSSASCEPPDWGDGWTPDDDDDFLFTQETIADAPPEEADTPIVGWGKVQSKEKVEADGTDWDAMLGEMGIPFGEPEPVKVTPEGLSETQLPQAAKVTTEWDDNVPF